MKLLSYGVQRRSEMSVLEMLTTVTILRVSQKNGAKLGENTPLTSLNVDT